MLLIKISCFYVFEVSCVSSPLRHDIVFPYRVCGMPQSTDTVRFGHDIQCPDIKYDNNATEGILVILKPNIEPYIFDVRIYSKEITIRYTYGGSLYTHDLGETVKKIAIKPEERSMIDAEGRCFSAATYHDTAGAKINAFNNDDTTNPKMLLRTSYFNSDRLRRYVTVTTLPPCHPGMWLRKTCTTVNCIVTDTKAKSKHPFKFFATATGEVIDVSPFYYGPESKEAYNEELQNFRIDYNYTRLAKPSNINSPSETIPKMAFLQRKEYSIAWEVKNKSQSGCRYVFWKSSTQAVKIEHNSSLHYTARDLTTTFISHYDKISLNNTMYSCAITEAKRIIAQQYEHLQTGYEKNDADFEVYKAQGGMLLAFQPIINKQLDVLRQNVSQLDEIRNNASHSRSKRELHEYGGMGIQSELLDIQYAQLQYTYNLLRDYINQMLNNIADAWCKDQKRTADMWNIISKINPSAVLSSIYDMPVSARYIGDILSVSSCVHVDQQSVKILQTLKVTAENTNETILGERCFSRPIVTFKFENDTKETVRRGQLAENNEILLGNHRYEDCKENAIHYFIAGESIHLFKDYNFHSTIPLSTVEKVDTFISLNVSLLETFDFQLLRLYTEKEQSAARIFDLETLLRDFNDYKNRLYVVEKNLEAQPYGPPAGLTDFLDGLGAVGRGLSTVISGAAGAASTIFGAITSFFTNPFGGLTTIIIAFLLCVIIVAVFRKTKNAQKNPIDFYFPYVNDVRRPPSASDLINEGGAKKPKAVPISDEQALEILRAIKRLSDSEQQKKNIAQAAPSLLDRMKNKNYKALK